MRGFRSLVVVGLGGFLAVGCSSSTTTDGGTTGAATTGGTTGATTTSGTTGTTTTGGTTGTTTASGTTTGGTSGLPVGSPCTANGQCSSDQCGIAGTGNCCTQVCDTSDASCGATACDGTGACTYPPNTTTCGSVTCTGSMLTASACNGTGTCTPGTPTACPNDLSCADGASCKTSCTTATDCANGFWCNAGACVARQATGACTENDACNSDVCGISGTGNCCTAACSTTDLSCGATACDGTGACVYPPAATPCGSTCTGATVTSNACNGAGTCVAGSAIACPMNLGCDSTGTMCNASCVSNTDCVGTNLNFCDKSTSGCCPAIANPGTLAVDGTTGSDATACCGYGTAGACQTLTKAMHLVDGTNSLNPGTALTLNATVKGVGGDWTNKETYPVSLGWGVTLYAPGVYFTDTAGPEIFDVALQPGEAAPGSIVTIQGFVNASGTSENPVVIGADTKGNLTSDTTSIVVEANETLNVNAVNVYEAAGDTGIWVSDSTATLDLDQAGAGGVLSVGPLPPSGSLPNLVAITAKMGTGILCNGTISDALSVAFPSSLRARGQNISIDAEGGCALSLIWAPTFGWSTAGDYTGAGSGCTGNPTPMDNIGIQANGNANVSLGSVFNAVSITCMSTFGITSTSPDGVNTPTVTLVATIENCAGAGIQVQAGSVTVQSGSIDHNFIGVDMENDGVDTPSVILNDGTNTNNTAVMCNSNQETGGTGNPGMDVYNNSTGNVAADYVSWDRWYDPNGGSTGTTTDIFDCDATFTCQCKVLDSTSTAACKTTAGGDDMDLVLGGSKDTTPTGTQTSTHGALAPGGACN